MKKYVCIDCSYSTNRNYNYNLHIESNKHLNRQTANPIPHNVDNNIKSDVNDNKNIDCTEFDDTMNDDMIDNIFNELNRKCNDDKVNKLYVEFKLMREKMKYMQKEQQLIETKYKQTIEEKNSSTEKLLREKDISTKKLIREKNNSAKNMADEKDNTIDILKCEVKSLESLIIGAGGLASQSMNVVSYLVKNYKNAPPLVEFKNCSIIKGDLDNYVENLLYFYNNGKLIKHISDCILNEYKKENKNEQSVWSSDVNRLTYIIKDILKDDATEWAYDKKGVNVCRYIITPLLNYIHNEIMEYMDDISVNIQNHGKMSNKMKKQMDTFPACNAILDKINNDTLRNEILRYIAPHFYVNKKTLALKQ